MRKLIAGVVLAAALLVGAGPLAGTASADTWDNFQPHDPGVTLVQVFAYVAESLTAPQDASADLHLATQRLIQGIVRCRRCVRP